MKTIAGPSLGPRGRPLSSLYSVGKSTKGAEMAPRREVHTVPTDKGWSNKAANGYKLSNHRTKSLAEKAGRKAAMARSALHVVHKQDGTVGRKTSYA
jgi:hypothetical protein